MAQIFFNRLSTYPLVKIHLSVAEMIYRSKTHLTVSKLNNDQQMQRNAKPGSQTLNFAIFYLLFLQIF